MGTQCLLYMRHLVKLCVALANEVYPEFSVESDKNRAKSTNFKVVC